MSQEIVKLRSTTQTPRPAAGSLPHFVGIAPVVQSLEPTETIIAQLRQIKQEFDLDRFFICAPNLEVRLGAIKGRDFYRTQGQKLNAIKTALQADGIEINWWCSPTFKVGLSATAQPITNIGGQEADVSHCPLDEAWAQQVISNMTAFAEACHPAIIMLEDDFELSNHPGVHFGCFCDRHLQKFAQKMGHFYSRAELEKEFTAGNIPLRRAWGELTVATLVAFAEKLRAAIDQVSPESRIGLCQAGCSRFDGNFLAPVAQALAGTRHRPMVRLCGSAYSSDESLDLIDALSFLPHYTQVLPENFEIYHETDSYPHNSFFVSARKLDALLTAAVTYGVKGSLFYALQYLDDPAEETCYLELWKKNHRKWQKMAELINRQALPYGFVRTTFRPDNSCAVTYAQRRPISCPNPWLKILGRYGIASSYLTASAPEPDSVIFVDVQDLKVMTTPEILDLLKRNIVIDGASALYLTEHGLSRYLGLTAYRDGERATFLYERIRDTVKPPQLRGQLMYNFVLAPAGQEGGGFVKIRDLAPGTEVLSDFVSAPDQVAQAGMVKFRNELGGQVLTIAYELISNASSSIFNRRKQELIVQEIEKMSGRPLPLRITHANVFTILQRSNVTGKFYATLIPLGSDPLDAIPAQWAAPPRQIRVLEADGIWKQVDFSAQLRDGQINCPLERLQPVFMEFTL